MWRPRDCNCHCLVEESSTSSESPSSQGSGSDDGGSDGASASSVSSTSENTGIPTTGCEILGCDFLPARLRTFVDLAHQGPFSDPCCPIFYAPHEYVADYVGFSGSANYTHPAGGSFLICTWLYRGEIEAECDFQFPVNGTVIRRPSFGLQYWKRTGQGVPEEHAMAATFGGGTNGRAPFYGYTLGYGDPVAELPWTSTANPVTNCAGPWTVPGVLVSGFVCDPAFYPETIEVSRA